MIRYVLMNSTVIILFVVPLITMRTYAEEKRSGTIELLLTSPVTDFQIIVGKFLGRDGALRGDARHHADPHGGALRLRQPRVEADRRPATSGLLLLGGCFISVGLFFSSLTRNQIVAGMFTFAVLLLLWVIDWIGQLRRARRSRRSSRTCRSPTTSTTSCAASSTRQHVVYYLSFITFGLFLTAKAVDSERWRG